MNRSMPWALMALTLAANGCQSMQNAPRRPLAETKSPMVQKTGLQIDPDTVLALPPRPRDAVSGRAFMQRLARLPVATRERAIVNEVLRGNVPAHLRTLAPLALGHVVRKGRNLPVTAWVMRDYIAIGSDSDYVHVPLSYDAALKLCAALGMALPTPRLVNAIYARANLRLTPTPLPPSQAMTSVAYFIRHNDVVASQLQQRLGKLAPGAGSRALARFLIAGHKKDVVATKRLQHRPDRVAIFGWHRPSTEPIQPLSLIHGRDYADYSHGVRLVAASLRIGDQKQTLDQAISSADVARVVSDEGSFATFAKISGLASRGQAGPKQSQWAFAKP